MVQSNPKYGVDWSRDELILALYYYCQIPFARTNANNPEVVKLANILGRSPSSVARKLGNFGAFDPVLAKKGISGLTHYSKEDKMVWLEFADKWDALVRESQRLLASLGITSQDEQTPDEPEFLPPTGTTERPVVGVQRVYQDFFRRAILASYDFTCCVCGAPSSSSRTSRYMLRDGSSLVRNS